MYQILSIVAGYCCVTWLILGLATLMYYDHPGNVPTKMWTFILAGPIAVPIWLITNCIRVCIKVVKGEY